MAKYGLDDICDELGMELMEVLEEATFGDCPAICLKCGHIDNLEPDQDAGYCPNCDTGSMKSCLILAGMI